MLCSLTLVMLRIILLLRWEEKRKKKKTHFSFRPIHSGRLLVAVSLSAQKVLKEENGSTFYRWKNRKLCCRNFFFFFYKISSTMKTMSRFHGWGVGWPNIFLVRFRALLLNLNSSCCRIVNLCIGRGYGVHARRYIIKIRKRRRRKIYPRICFLPCEGLDRMRIEVRSCFW